MSETREATAAPETAPAEHNVQPAAHAHEHVHTAPPMNPELTREVAVEASADEVSKSFRQVLKRYQKMARIPGFRAGKVPESVVRSKFQREVRQEVLESLVSRRFRTALEEQGLNPVSEPQLTDLQLVDGQPLRFKAQFEVQPTVDINGWETVSVQRPETALTDAEFRAELDRVLDGYATVETIEEDRPLADGDWAEIEFKGVIRGLEPPTDEAVEPVEGTEAQPIQGEDVLVEVGGANTLPAFTEALRGNKPGQELRFEAEYPKEFGEPRLAGKTVAYDVTVKGLKKKSFPERDAEFAKQLGNYDSFEAFETSLREMAGKRKKDSLEAQAKDAMLEQMVERFPFPVPEVFVQQQIEARLERGLRALAQQGMPPEQMRQLDFGRLREAQREQAVREVKASMLLDRLAEAESVTVSDDDVDRELLMISLQRREPLETVREQMTSDGSLNQMRDQMRRERAGTAAYEKLAS